MKVNVNIDKFIAKYGDTLHVTAEDFEEAPMSDKERMEMIEDCIMELAEIIGGEGE